MTEVYVDQKTTKATTAFGIEVLDNYGYRLAKGKIRCQRTCQDCTFASRLDSYLNLVVKEQFAFGGIEYPKSIREEGLFLLGGLDCKPNAPYVKKMIVESVTKVRKNDIGGYTIFFNAVYGERKPQSFQVMTRRHTIIHRRQK